MKKLKLPFDLYDLLIFAGAAATVFGIWQIYHPAAYIIGGAAFIYVGLLGSRPGLKEKK